MKDVTAKSDKLAEERANDSVIGVVTSVRGAGIKARALSGRRVGDNETGRFAQMGSLLRVETGKAIVLGLVSTLDDTSRAGDGGDKSFSLELVGERQRQENGELGRFRRGVTDYPALGDKVYPATRDDLVKTFAGNGDQKIRIGSILQNANIPVLIQVDEMLGKHFAIVGASGTGKSCAVSLALHGIVGKNEHAHVVALDPHGEYAKCFGSIAEVLNIKTLNLPFWLLTFEEFVETVMRDERGAAEIEILRELIPEAKRLYAANMGRQKSVLINKKIFDQMTFSVDTPAPFRISDLESLITNHMGRLELQRDLMPYKRLRAHIETITQDPRYAFMFGGLTVQDTMADVLGRLFRIPTDAKPLTILDLAGLPSEVINVVVSVVARLTFDFAVWSEGRVPVTLVCEEAHHYAPADVGQGFEPAKRALSRLAKEGRKYGVSLGVISQRPAELAPNILSQCNTVFAMRLTNERDQEIVRAGISDSARSLLEFLPSLGAQEAIAFGDGVPLPLRMRFDDLPPARSPRSRTAKFSQVWKNQIGDARFLQDVVTRWRAQIRVEENQDEIDAPPAPQVSAPADAGDAQHAEAPPPIARTK